MNERRKFWIISQFQPGTCYETEKAAAEKALNMAEDLNAEVFVYEVVRSFKKSTIVESKFTETAQED